MENQEFDSRQSLALITEMINNTRSQMERNAGRPLVVWGYVTIAVTIAVWFALRETGDSRWNLLWFGIPLLGGLLMRLTRNRKPAGVRTYIDRIIDQIWLVLGLTAFGIGTLTMFLPRQMPVLFLITLLMSIGVTLTGLVIRFRPGTFGGAAGILLSGCFLAVHGVDACLLFAAAFLIMMVIPGHILNYRSNRVKSGTRHV